MPMPQGRDLELTRKQLREFFAAELPDAEDLRLSPLRGPGTTGFSNDTLMFDLEWREGGRARREALVVRISPSGVRVFPDYDLGLQYRVLRQLEPTSVPVPRVRWMNADGRVLGDPFYVMERVEGRIPPDNPTYHAEGWMTEIEDSDREAIWWSGLEVLTRIHRLDWPRLGFDFLLTAKAGADPLGEQLEYYERFLAWAAEGRPQPTTSAALEELKRRRPPLERLALCWGDSRLGNMIFRENRCVAVLDWEMAIVADPEQDLAWWLFFDEHHSSGADIPRLGGLPSRAETVARYQEWTGWKVRHLEYYEAFAAFRFAVIMIRIARMLAAHGLLPEDSEFERNNTCTRMLARMLDLPPPEA
ncbi:MAG: phosphotransferase family protein [Myxococcota bacterium]